MTCRCGSDDTVVITVSQAHSVVYLRLRCRTCTAEFERIGNNEQGGGTPNHQRRYVDRRLPPDYRPPRIAPPREDPPPPRRQLPRATPIYRPFNVRIKTRSGDAGDRSATKGTMP